MIRNAWAKRIMSQMAVSDLYVFGVCLSCVFAVYQLKAVSTRNPASRI